MRSFRFNVPQAHSNHQELLAPIARSLAMSNSADGGGFVDEQEPGECGMVPRPFTFSTPIPVAKNYIWFSVRAIDRSIFTWSTGGKKFWTDSNPIPVKYWCITSITLLIPLKFLVVVIVVN